MVPDAVQVQQDNMEVDAREQQQQQQQQMQGHAPPATLQRQDAEGYMDEADAEYEGDG